MKRDKKTYEIFYQDGVLTFDGYSVRAKRLRSAVRKARKHARKSDHSNWTVSMVYCSATDVTHFGPFPYNKKFGKK